MRLRLPVPREESFSSRLRSAAIAARIGLWLGVCFGIAFVTGLISHYAQEPHQPAGFPTDPAWGYRLTQSLHVVAGTAAIPLLLVKLWAVYPKLFARPSRHPLVLLRTGLERASIAVLVAGSILQLSTGLMNVPHWYAWGFSFRRTHYALAWIVIGALLVHIAVKLPIIRRALGSDIDATGADRPTAVRQGPVSRRMLLRGTWLAAAVAVVTASSAAGTLPGLGRVALLSPRSRRSGLPVNRTAAQAGVVAAATTADYRCRVEYAGRSLELTRDELLALPQATHVLPIGCVEGWSADGRWTGVPLRTLLARLDIAPGHHVRIHSLQQHGADRVTELPANFVDDERTLLALALDGEPLALDHGFPARIIAPDRPGALQTKWVARIEVL